MILHNCHNEFHIEAELIFEVTGYTHAKMTTLGLCQVMSRIEVFAPWAPDDMVMENERWGEPFGEMAEMIRMP